MVSSSLSPLLLLLFVGLCAAEPIRNRFSLYAFPQQQVGQYNEVAREILPTDPVEEMDPQVEHYEHPYAGFSLHSGTTAAPQTFLRNECSKLPNGRGQTMHPLYCDKYIDCWDGRALEKICPYGQLYSDLPGGFCDNREYVECGSRDDPEITQHVP